MGEKKMYFWVQLEFVQRSKYMEGRAMVILEKDGQQGNF